MNNQSTPKVGDKIIVTEGNEPYYKVGDKGVLLTDTSDGVSAGCWADFSENEEFYEDGVWYIDPNMFDVVEEAPNDNEHTKG